MVSKPWLRMASLHWYQKRRQRGEGEGEGEDDGGRESQFN